MYIGFVQGLTRIAEQGICGVFPILPDILAKRLLRLVEASGAQRGEIQDTTTQCGDLGTTEEERRRGRETAKGRHLTKSPPPSGAGGTPCLL